MTDDLRFPKPLVDQQTLTELAEIKLLMAEAYRHALAIDGHAKSGEGHVSLDVIKAWYFENGNYERPEVNIYNYVLPLESKAEGILPGGRRHFYDNATQALEDVRRAHAEVMTWKPYEREEGE